MSVECFDEDEILSSEDLIVGALRKLLRVYAEISRREEDSRGFLKKLCSFSIETWVWYILLEAGGSQRFTDILVVVGCSQTSLSDALQKLVREGLVRRVGKRYQAVVPAGLLHGCSSFLE